MAPGPVTCFLFILGQCHLQFYLLKCLFSRDNGEEFIASCPSVTLYTLMFTAPEHSLAPRALPLPDDGELTTVTGPGPLGIQALLSHSTFLLPPICPLPWNQQVAGWNIFKQEVESLTEIP